MKKKLFLLVMLAAALAFGLVVAGCEDGNDTASSGGNDGSNGKGVLGTISGIVVDEVTGQPLEGVAVVVNGAAGVTTDANGAYIIENLIPNKKGGGDGYNLGFVKEGYKVDTSKTVVVDPEEYKNADPFAEYEALKEQLIALKDWADGVDLSALVNLTTLTYSDGAFITSDGKTITYNKDLGTFEIQDKQLDYTYAYVQGLGITQLKPLSGGLKGTIKLVVGYDDSETVSTTVNIPDDIDIWVNEYTTGGTATGAAYGPVKTRDGGFEITDLPAKSAFTLSANGFYYEDAGGARYYYNGVGNTEIKTVAYLKTKINGGTPATGDSTEDTAGVSSSLVTTVNTVYLFAQRDVAFVIAANVGEENKATPIKVTDPITLTFGKPVNTATFSADIGALKLSPTWSEGDTRVSLIPAAAPAGKNTRQLPYAAGVGTDIGNLKISGKAKDGSVIYFANAGIPVYTEVGLAFVSLEVEAAPPARTIAVSKGQALKLTFTKGVAAISTTAFYEYGGGNNIRKLDYKIDGAAVHVYIDSFWTTGNGKINVVDLVSASDPEDSFSAQAGNDIVAGEPATNSFTLTGTSLYAPPGTNPSADNPYGAPADPSAAYAYLPRTTTVFTFTFLEAFPSGATVAAKLVKYPGGSADVIPVTAVVAGKTVTITRSTNASTAPYPGVDNWDTADSAQYGIQFEVRLGTKALFDSATAAISTDAAAKVSNYIAFTTNRPVHATTPQISVHPQDANYVLNDTAVSLWVSATISDSGTLSYQWYRNTANNNYGGNRITTNGTSASYTPPTTTRGTVYYYVEVTNTITNNGDGGRKTATATSDAAAIAVGMVNAATPQIIAQPQDANYALNNAAASLSVTAMRSDGGILSYQWYSNYWNSNSGGSVITGETASSYTPSTATVGTVYYYVIVTNTIVDNGDGGNKTASVTSDAAAIVTTSSAPDLTSIVTAGTFSDLQSFSPTETKDYALAIPASSSVTIDVADADNAGYYGLTDSLGDVKYGISWQDDGSVECAMADTTSSNNYGIYTVNNSIGSSRTIIIHVEAYNAGGFGNFRIRYTF
ncbi:MAG: carboxypeptidase-like regulatory domain-containing protein [Treponema sp.]|nr:carboxypeptidase-like regulatory domain-containing protein [Treponema sp.]